MELLEDSRKKLLDIVNDTTGWSKCQNVVGVTLILIPDIDGSIFAQQPYPIIIMIIIQTYYCFIYRPFVIRDTLSNVFDGSRRSNINHLQSTRNTMR